MLRLFNARSHIENILISSCLGLVVLTDRYPKTENSNKELLHPLGVDSIRCRLRRVIEIEESL